MRLLDRVESLAPDLGYLTNDIRELAHADRQRVQPTVPNPACNRGRETQAHTGKRKAATANGGQAACGFGAEGKASTPQGNAPVPECVGGQTRAMGGPAGPGSKAQANL